MAAIGGECTIEVTGLDMNSRPTPSATATVSDVPNTRSVRTFLSQSGADPSIGIKKLLGLTSLNLPFSLKVIMEIN
jgi:hypothetical protein